MAKAWVHACSSAKKFGGEPEDYLEIHNHLDSTKSVVADNRHRFITHNAWYIGPDGPLEKIFGIVITNSDGRKIAVRAIAEQHLLEDFGGFIPTLNDYINENAVSSLDERSSTTALSGKHRSQIPPK